MKNGDMDSLRTRLKSYGRVVVAYSGGVDSSFLLRLCADALGGGNVVAATGASETYTPSELEFARNFAGNAGVRHVVIRTDEIADVEFASNTKLRCYHCKKNFYSKVREIAVSEGVDVIVDGTNRDDDADYRPGRMAAAEYGVASPLAEEGFTKEDIRNRSREIGLESWDRPANPCLASRVPYGSRITREKLEVIARAEEFIRRAGFYIVRVRHHGPLARIELPVEDISRFMEHETREDANRYLKGLGFTWIAVDIGGYRTGSMNEPLTDVKYKLW